MAVHRQGLARRGEDLAAQWYEEHGYEVVARNWSCRAGELDIVARRGQELVFCEVKARSSVAFGLPAEAVGVAKQARLRRLATLWLAEQRRRAAAGGAGARRAGRGQFSSGQGSSGQRASGEGASGQRDGAAWPAGGSRHADALLVGRWLVRFDVAGVLAGRIEVVEGAF